MSSVSGTQMQRDHKNPPRLLPSSVRLTCIRIREIFLDDVLLDIFASLHWVFQVLEF